MSNVQVSEYLEKHNMRVRLTIYHSGMSGYVGSVYSTLPGMELLADSRGDTLEECMENLDKECGKLLEAERGKG